MQFRQRYRKVAPEESDREPVIEHSGGREVSPQSSELIKIPEPAVPEYLEVRSLSSLENEWKEKTHAKLLDIIDLSLIGTLEESDARSQIVEISHRILQDESAPLNTTQRQKVVKAINDEVLGLGPLEDLLDDFSISDILVNGAANVYIERHGKLYRTDVRFNSDRHLMNIIDRIVSAVGRRIDEGSPMVDARLEDGSRVNAIIPPLSLDGPSLSIRRFGREKFTIEDLVSLGTLTGEVSAVLDAMVKARLNILISGGTGSGKTTLLNIVSSFIPATERIVTIEDSAELQLRQPHVVRLETRPPNIEGKGEINQRELVRNSLRMRPDRIVIGEVRGAESLDMLQAMNTGHDGSLTTVHANSARDALSRIETMVTMSGIDFPIKTMRAQMAAAIDAVIQVERHEDGRRRIVSLQEIEGMEGDIITMSELFRFERETIDEEGNVIGALKPTGVVPKFHRTLSQRGIELPVAVFNHHLWSPEGADQSVERS